MGLAASQARWISLTARKSNVEYEGQQINQARTALANQASELWNQLFMMKVPTPPSTQDFCEVQYEFNNGDQDQTIKEIQAVNYYDPVDNITYNSFVTYYSPVDEYMGVRLTDSNPQVQHVYTQKDPETGLDILGGDYYLVGNKRYICLNDFDEKDSVDPTSEWQVFKTALDEIAASDSEWKDTSLAQYWRAAKGTGDYSNIYYYTDTANKHIFALGNTQTVQKDTLDDCIADINQSLHTYYAENQKINKELSKYAIVEYDSSNRAKTIRLQGSSIVYDINANTTTDDAAYADAMNQYNYDKQVYEKNVQDINARTEQIQTEDRTLELRLRALDTEQNALQTEMDAVHKIISKNIESTFKTFES